MSPSVRIRRVLGLAALAAALLAPGAASRESVAGGQIVFLSDRTPGLGSFAVAVMNRDGSAQHLLTHPDPRAIDPVWLPGGKQIAFESVATPGDREVYGGVWRLHPDGSHPEWLLRRITRLSPDPAWSPDGKQMAFVRGSGLYLARPNGSKARPIFWDTRVLARPTWSPDGRRLAVADTAGILVVALGGKRARLLFRTHPLVYADAPSWSPNGRRIAYIGVPRIGGPSLYMTNADGTHLRLLARSVGFLGGGPSWSPDSTRVVVGRLTRSSQVPAISVVDVKTRRSRTIARGGSAPQWSPSGHRIAFASYTPGGLGGIYLVRPDGSQRRLLVPFGGAPRFSPNGRMLALLAEGRNAARIGGVGAALYVANIDGTQLRQLTHPFDDIEAVGSPDHSKIAFVRSLPGKPGTREPGTQSVYVVGRDGRGLRRIGSGDAVAWAPDSAEVTFAQSGDIFSAPTDGGPSRQLTSGPETDSAPAWSLDGRMIAFSRTFTRSTSDVCLVDVATATPGAMSCLSAGGGNPVWSPDGTLIAFAIGGSAGPPESTAIGVIHPDGSGRRLLAQGYAPAWAADGRRLAFIDLSTSPDGNLAVVGADGTGFVRIDTLSLPEPPTWSADGSRLASASCPPQLYDCEIWLVAPEGLPTPSRLTRNLVDDLAPVWW